jgi:hypothetical protein
MAESDVRKLLAPLTLRSDVPQDARDAIAEDTHGAGAAAGDAGDGHPPHAGTGV